MRTYEQGYADALRLLTDAVMCAHIVAMDDRRLCRDTIEAVTRKADFLFAQVLEGNLTLADIQEEAGRILKVK